MHTTSNQSVRRAVAASGCRVGPCKVAIDAVERPGRVRRPCVRVAGAAVLLLAGCAYQPHPIADGPPGFFSGLLHGFLILFSLIASIFTDVRIYAFPNAGGWYDFGFVVGATAFLGGGGASTR